MEVRAKNYILSNAFSEIIKYSQTCVTGLTVLSKFGIEICHVRENKWMMTQESRENGKCSFYQVTLFWSLQSILDKAVRVPQALPHSLSK